MQGTETLGKILVVLGLGLAGFGALLFLGGRLLGLGRLPGDIYVQRGNWVFHFPLASALLVSIVLTVLLNLFFFLRPR